MLPVFRALVRVLPTRLATRLAISLSTRSMRPPPRAEELAALAAGRELTWGPGGTLKAWEWGEGPLVVLVHGWGGHAGQMAALAQAVAAEGFRAVAVDLSGHGRSAGSRITWAGLIRDAANAAMAFGNVHALVGHSAGGLAAMAARKAGLLHAACYACVAAPSHPFPPIVAVKARLRPPARVVKRYEDYLGAEFCTTWTALATGSSFDGLGEDLLLVYDEDDKYVPHPEGDRLHARCPGSRLVKVREGGHTRMLAAPWVASSVVGFLGKDRAQ